MYNALIRVNLHSSWELAYKFQQITMSHRCKLIYISIFMFASIIGRSIDYDGCCITCIEWVGKYYVTSFGAWIVIATKMPGLSHDPNLQVVCMGAFFGRDSSRELAHEWPLFNLNTLQ